MKGCVGAFSLRILSHFSFFSCVLFPPKSMLRFMFPVSAIGYVCLCVSVCQWFKDLIFSHSRNCSPT